MSFNEVIDQESAVKILKEELKSERINHAYLFCGKEGIGKKTLAFEFTKSLMCQEIDFDNCNTCITCKKIEHHNHPDVKFIKTEEDSNQIKIDQIRELQKEITLRPYETERKIYIIDEADKMNPAAANCLLKTLEEPPDYAVIILLAEKKDHLLPTIISRCQQLQLSNISQKEIRKYLQKKDLEEDKLRLYSLLAEGSLGKALELVNNSDFLNKRKELLEILARLPGLDRVDIFDYAGQLANTFDNSTQLFNLISGWYRDIILYTGGNKETILNYDFLNSIEKQSQEYNIQQLLDIIKLINKYENYVERNVRKKLTLQVLMIKIRSKRV
ncbi:MAG: DNA polymerase III subunit delta' [Bacillota bacterium]